MTLDLPMILRSLVAAALAALLSTLASGASDPPSADTGREPVRVFIFAGQSNMVGSDSKVSDIERFPPFAGLGEPQEKVRFQYCIGREQKMRSDGWVELEPVNGVVGPELSFAREVAGAIDAPIAIMRARAASRRGYGARDASSNTSISKHRNSSVAKPEPAVMPRVAVTLRE